MCSDCCDKRRARDRRRRRARRDAGLCSNCGRTTRSGVPMRPSRSGSSPAHSTSVRTAASAADRLGCRCPPELVNTDSVGRLPTTAVSTSNPLLRPRPAFKSTWLLQSQRQNVITLHNLTREGIRPWRSRRPSLGPAPIPTAAGSMRRLNAREGAPWKAGIFVGHRVFLRADSALYHHALMMFRDRQEGFAIAVTVSPGRVRQMQGLDEAPWHWERGDEGALRQWRCRTVCPTARPSRRAAWCAGYAISPEPRRPQGRTDTSQSANQETLPSKPPKLTGHPSGNEEVLSTPATATPVSACQPCTSVTPYSLGLTPLG